MRDHPRGRRYGGGGHAQSETRERSYSRSRLDRVHALPPPNPEGGIRGARAMEESALVDKSPLPTACRQPPWQWLLDRKDAEKITLLRQFEESLRLAKEKK